MNKNTNNNNNNNTDGNAMDGLGDGLQSISMNMGVSVVDEALMLRYEEYLNSNGNDNNDTDGNGSAAGTGSGGDSGDGVVSGERIKKKANKRVSQWRYIYMCIGVYSGV